MSAWQTTCPSELLPQKNKNQSPVKALARNVRFASNFTAEVEAFYFECYLVKDLVIFLPNLLGWATNCVVFFLETSLSQHLGLPFPSLHIM